MDAVLDRSVSDSWSLKLFGQVQVERDDRCWSQFASHRIPALLGYLACRGNHPVHRRHVAAALWPDKEDGTARQNLRQTLFLLHRQVGKGMVVADGDFLLLASNVSHDLGRFRCGEIDLPNEEFLEGLGDDWVIDIRREVDARRSALDSRGQTRTPGISPFQMLVTRPREHLALAVAMTPSWVSAGSTREGLARVEEALAASRSGRPSRLRDRALLAQGKLAIACSNGTEAYRIAEELRHRTAFATGSLEWAELMLLLTRIHIFRHEFGRAREMGLEAWNSALRLDEAWTAAEAAIRITSLGRILNRTDEAIEFSLRSVEQAARTRDAALLGQSLGARVAALRGIGSTEDARRAAFQSLDLMSQMERPGDMAIRMSRLGRNLEGMGELDAAHRAYRLGHDAIATTDDEEGLAECAVYLGDLLNRLGWPAEAETYHAKAAAIRKQLGDHWGQGSALRGLGLSRLAQQDFTGAEAAFREAQTLLQRFGPLYMASTLLPLAEAQKGLGKREAALQNLRAAKTIMGQFDDATREFHAPGDLLSFERARRIEACMSKK